MIHTNEDVKRNLGIDKAVNSWIPGYIQECVDKAQARLKAGHYDVVEDYLNIIADHAERMKEDGK